jgi:hypothetical protein
MKNGQKGGLQSTEAGDNVHYGLSKTTRFG